MSRRVNGVDEVLPSSDPKWRLRQLAMPLSAFSVPTTSDTFGGTVRELRTFRGMSLRKLARSVGISATYLSHIELGRCPSPCVPRIRRIAQALDADLFTLLRLSGRGPDLAAEIVRERSDLLDVLIEAHEQPKEKRVEVA